MSQARPLLRSFAETLSYGKTYSSGTGIRKRMLRIWSMTCTLSVANRLHVKGTTPDEICARCSAKSQSGNALPAKAVKMHGLHRTS